VVDLVDPLKQEKLLRFADVGEVWGIGRQLNKPLELMGITKAWHLATFDKKTVRRHFNINVEKTARELSGEYCYELEEDVTPKQIIACTRSFSQRVTTLDGIRSAISTFVANASRKLRTQNQYAACVQVFVRTSRFDTTGMPYAGSVSIPLAHPSFDTSDLLEAALAGLQQIYIDGPRYAKAQPKRKNSEQLMTVLDRIRIIHGRGSVRFASEPATAP
jgi:DNA polymerase V